jgi:hypothetical protein
VSPEQNEFEAAKTLVEATLHKLGLDPAACRAAASAAATDTKASWTLKRGSASILVSVTKYEEEKETFLRVASPVVTLPADPAKQAACMRKLLELNATGLVNAAFGLSGDRVVAVSERPAAGLDANEVDQIVRHLSAVADTFDNRLEKEFGATKA